MSRTARLILRFTVVLCALVILGLSRPSQLFKSDITAQVVDPCAAPVTNPIACENSQTGNPSSEWDITGAGSPTIQGFATDISVNRGQTVRFKINTPATSYGIDIYRLGYYGGAGARKVASLAPTALLPQAQPACTSDSTTGLVDCGVWAESASWAVPATAVSGIYLAKLTRTDATPGASHIVFVVRDDTGQSDLLFQTSDTTWQAYNRYGGNSLYNGSPAGRAYKVSYNRPFTTRDHAPEDFVFNAEYPMVRFLEANGFKVSYTTGVDTDRRGAELTEHKVFLSVGHDEYWSAGQRANVEAARDAGVHLAFFSGNEMFWKTRWEPSIDGSATDYRTLVSYKETHANAKIDPASGIWTGTWRDARFSPPNDGGRPENSLTGQLFMVNSGTAAIEVPEVMGKFRLWRNTSVATLATGTVATLTAGSLGYEWNESPAANAPAGLIRLSSTTRSGVEKLQDNGSTYAAGTATHNLSLYRAGSGALVFGAGTVQWSWGLDAVHDRAGSPADVRMGQATVNLLADMGAQPGTLQAGLTAATLSADLAAPTSSIASPRANSTLLLGSTVTVSGTAADTGGVLAAVDVSTDGGTTWKRATGTTAWSFAWTPAAVGNYSLMSRAIDDSGNIGVNGTAVSVNVAVTLCPCSLWQETAVPANVDAGADNPVNLGVKFRSTSDGYIGAIKFYKSAANTGTHVVSLYELSGTVLGTATSSNETASGWQTVVFATPIPVTAETFYVAAYHTTVGHYAFSPAYFATNGVTSGPLDAPATGVTANGVYRYGTPQLPTSTYNASNYWVDVVFTTDVSDLTPPNVTSVSPANAATVNDINTNVQAVFGEDMDPATLTSSTFELRNSANALIPAVVSYTGATRTAMLDPSVGLVSGGTYTASIRGGTADPVVRDLAGNAMAQTYTWTFTVAGDTTPPNVTGVTPAGGATAVGVATQVSAVFSEPLDAATVNGATFELRNPSSVVITAAVTYDAATRTATLTPTAALATSTTYTATVRGGAADPRVKDAAGNGLAANFTWSFTTASVVPSGCPCTLWNNSITPSVIDSGDANPVELGVKFRSDIDGFITGIRFYKATTNTGAHVGSLWTTGGTLLGSATFSNETSFGWQQVTFATPIAVTANTTYVASYFAPNGHFSYNSAFFGSGVDTPPLHAIANGTSPNGIYRYGSSGFPTSTWNANNYWVDVVFSTTTTDAEAPLIVGQSPIAGGSGLGVNTSISATFNEDMNASTIDSTTFTLTAGSTAVAGTVSYNSSTRTAVFQPSAPLAYSTTYTARVRGGSTGPRVRDLAGNALAGDFIWSFTTGGQLVTTPITGGPGGPVLVVTSSSNAFTTYYAEILRAEGLNAFATADIQGLTAGTLTGYDVVVLGEMALTASQVTMFSTWVNNGGNLIAMRPDKQLATVLGLTSTTGTLSDKYMLVNTATAPGAGIVAESMQFHGTADIYTLNGATTVATLYSTATTATVNPAVTLRTNGAGMAGAFTYDLAKSVVFTRQGNPAWSGQERDGLTPIRSDDLFFGAAAADPQADYVDFTKIAIPQADEQQRLLANMIIHMNLSRKPLPRFWYLPRGLKAAVVMTGDDHANQGTKARYDINKGQSPAGCSVDDWTCIRSTSYVYPLAGVDYGSYTAEGFETAVHINTACGNYNRASLEQAYDSQIALFRQYSPNSGVPTTNRTHCIVWSDFSTQAEVAASRGIRLDTNYYYWPGTWVLDRPGVFTGSGMPMRFATATGTMLDIYQAATQLTDESQQNYALHIDTLLNRALGAEGYYGTFVANMHTDFAAHAGSDTIITSAKAKGVPVISAKQLLTWVDGRNASTFSGLSYITNLPNAPQGGSRLTFAVTAPAGTTGLQGMLPYRLRNGVGRLISVQRDGLPVGVQVQTIKGVQYAVFNAVPGSYVAEYDTTAPTTTFTSTPSTSTIDSTASFAFTANEAGSTFECSLDSAAFTSCASPTLLTGIAAGSHTFRVRGTDVEGNVAATPASYTWSRDISAPTIVTRTPAPGATAVALGSAVTVQFSESMNASSLTSATVRLRRVGGASDVPAAVSASGATATLQPSASLLMGVQYEVTVASTVTDVAGNALGADSTWTFTTFNRVSDSLLSEFSAGTADASGRITQQVDGELMLAPTDGGEFTTMPAGWSTTQWSPTGTGTLASGWLTVNGARVNPTATGNAGRSVEFVATFGSEAYQHIGFGVALDAAPWAIFSTRNGGGLYARTSNGAPETVTALTTTLNTPHTFRIDWNAASVVYWVDGVQVASHPVTIAVAMRPLVSDLQASGDSVRVDWLQLTPYASASTFTSRVFDAAATATWTTASWTAVLPTGTSVVVSVRTGNTATPDATWSAYAPVSGSGGSVNLSGRYAQYRVQLATTAPGQSPRVHDVTLSVNVQ